MDLEIWQIMILILVGACAAFIQRVSGFGMGIFAMLFLPYLFSDAVIAAAVVGAWSCFTCSCNSIKYRRHIKPRLILPMAGAALVTIPLAILCSSMVPKQTMLILLGIVLIMLSLYFLLFSKKIHLKTSTGTGVLVGALGGTLSGLFSTGGPPAVLYLSGVVEEKDTYFANIQFYFALTNLYAFIVRILNGIMTGTVLMYTLIGLAGALLGDGLGVLVFRKLDGNRIKQIIYFGMIVSGILMLV